MDLELEMAAGIKGSLLPVLRLVRGVLGGSQAEDLEGGAATAHHLSEVQIGHTVDVVVPEEDLLVGLADAAVARGRRPLEVQDTGLADVPQAIHEVGGGAPAPLHVGERAVDDLIPDPGAHTRAGRILTPALGQGRGHRVRVVALTPPLAAVPSIALAAARSRAAFPRRPREKTVFVALTEQVIAATISGTANHVVAALKKTSQSYFANHVFGHYDVLYVLAIKILPKAPVFGPFSLCHQSHLGQTAC